MNELPKLNVDEEPQVEEKPQEKIISLDDIAAKESVKNPYNNEIFSNSIDLQNGTKIPYRFKSIDMEDYLEAQVDGSTDEMAINVLSISLLDDNDELYTRERIIKGVPKQWRIIILGDILSESGISIDPEILGF